jgi:hypothetical protein
VTCIRTRHWKGEVPRVGEPMGRPGAGAEMSARRHDGNRGMDEPREVPGPLTNHLLPQ